MIITSQRVTRDGKNGINSFLYLHKLDEWPEPPPDMEALGADGKWSAVLEHSIRAINDVGGNPIVSYLDLIAPDGTPFAVIREAFIAAIAKPPLSGQPFPWSDLVSGQFRFNLAMTRAFSRAWNLECAALLAGCDLVSRTYLEGRVVS